MPAPYEATADSNAFTPATSVEMGRLFRAGAALVTQYGVHDDFLLGWRMPPHSREKAFYGDSGFELYERTNRLRAKVPVAQAVGVLGLTQSFRVHTRGQTAQHRYARVHCPEHVSITLDQEPPYKTDSFYCRVYQFTRYDKGQVWGHSFIMEDYIPPDETLESFMEARQQEALTGSISRAEYFALEALLAACRVHRQNRGKKLLPRVILHI